MRASSRSGRSAVSMLAVSCPKDPLLNTATAASGQITIFNVPRASNLPGVCQRGLSVGELLTGHMLFGLNPFRRQLALLVRTIHYECRHYGRLPQPPHAKAVARKISPVNDFVGDGRIAPKLVREIEHIGKEIRHVLERSSLAHERPGTVLT